MKKLIAFEFISLDGFMAGSPGHEMDFVKDGFNDAMEENLAQQYQALDTFVMGKTTFESLAGYWPTPAANGEVLQNVMNSMAKVVCSAKGTQVQWNNSRVLPENISEEIGKIKESLGKDIMIIGSASIVQTLTKELLIDEYRFFLFRVVLGAGKPLFSSRSKPLPLKMVNLERFNTGVVRVDYART
jgi:dihydrofolate reductase